MGPRIGIWLKRAAVTARAALCLIAATGAQPAKAQISIQVPFVSLGIGAPAYYPYSYPYYYGYGYPYYYRHAYYGYHYRRCHWWHHHCHYY